MKTLTLQVTAVANGGAAIGHDPDGRTIFVPYAIPGETVRVHLVEEKAHHAHAHLEEILTPSRERVTPACPHFGACAGCHFQHIAYPAQLRIKQEIVRDQFQRIGNFPNAPVKATQPHPTPWAYSIELPLNPTAEGGFGLWSPTEKRVIPITACPISHPALAALLQDIDLELPSLRRLTLRIGDDEALLAALETDDVEPPELEADFPISVAMVLPDGTAASLIGDNYIVQSVKGRNFRVSPGCYFPPSPAAAALVVDQMLAYAGLRGAEKVLELYSGVGLLTAFLAAGAAEVVAIELNEDAVADTAVNLPDADNVTLYTGWVEDILPALAVQPDLVVMNPSAQGLTREARTAVTNLRAPRLIYVSSDVATLARDTKFLARAGYQLIEVQPIDMRPQTYHVETVSLWQHAS